ncbi:adenylate/guanylate cyclase domain-containing protein [Pararhizobium sp. BT-229]|uniref:adenylate/guanylate cyclase domain-containing protein n=1 Tax=Pararhizobium sp. BT-229 TaxID=2986923 RepID=UPI0021F7A4D4|nr:adenylate/guanylate cyclase domain-containing protein [Pararhizobium sp. BT-229]MCV9962929.1 adenylate/guanylate cyclase domain-containing protein [Pararhizobium sp. BT-229]
MSEPRRKLTTIFFADVQDYTRLMGADEEGTVETLKRYRDAMARLIGTHGGRVINTWGDGLIAEFPSVVEAVRAAVDVQNELAGLNATRPADGRMLFRIGINLGDVIADGDDIYGDGVNIAARLQASAPAGGVVISNTVYDQVRNKIPVGFDFLGPLTVKNVEEAVPSYAVRIGGRTDDTARPTSAIPNPPIHNPLPDATAMKTQSGVHGQRTFRLLGLAAATLVAINLLSWRGTFWAVWPLLVLAVLYALIWVRNQNRIDRSLGNLATLGLGLVAINVLSWQGTFWAIWPLLAISVAAGARWLARR